MLHNVYAMSNLSLKQTITKCSPGSQMLAFSFLFFSFTFKSGLSLKIEKIHIHLYLIAAKYLWNNAFVEYIDN